MPTNISKPVLLANNYHAWIKDVAKHYDVSMHEVVKRALDNYATKFVGTLSKIPQEEAVNKLP